MATSLDVINNALHIESLLDLTSWTTWADLKRRGLWPMSKTAAFKAMRLLQDERRVQSRFSDGKCKEYKLIGALGCIVMREGR